MFLRNRLLIGLLVLPLVWGFAVACDDEDVDEALDRARTEVPEAGTEISEGVEEARTKVRETGTQISEGVDEARTEVSERTDDDGTPEAGGAEAGATVEFVSPEDGDTVDGLDVTLEVDVDDFDVVDKLGEPAEDGEGHIHYYIDVDDVPTEPGQPAVTGDDRTYHATSEMSHTFDDVDPGEHTFAIQLVNNDHTPLEPPVVEEITITVE